MPRSGGGGGGEESWAASRALAESGEFAGPKEATGISVDLLEQRQRLGLRQDVLDIREVEQLDELLRWHLSHQLPDRQAVAVGETVILLTPSFCIPVETPTKGRARGVQQKDSLADG